MRASHARAAEWGLSEQQASAFCDARFAALPIDLVRLVAPWDVAWSDPAMVDAWLSQAHGRGLTPLVAFERAGRGRCPGTPCRSPAVAEYRDATAAFRARCPAVREFSSWNEPNHPSQPTVSEPVATAALHDALVGDCPGCTSCRTLSSLCLQAKPAGGAIGVRGGFVLLRGRDGQRASDLALARSGQLDGERRAELESGMVERHRRLQPRERRGPW